MNRLRDEFFSHLKKDESLFSFLLDHSLDGIWFWNLENREEGWMNGTFWSALGYDPKNPPHWKEVLFPDDQGAVREAFYKHLEDGSEYFETVLRYKHALGTTSWFRCRGKCIRNDQGVPIRLLGSNIDITKVKERETETNTLLARLSSILMNVGDMVFLLDRQYVFQELKQYDSADHIVKQENYIGKSIYDIPFAEDTKRKIVKAIEKTFQTREKTYVDYSIPFPDGERYFHLLISPILYENKDVTEVIAVARNVTETLHLQSAIEEGNKIFINGPMVVFRWSFSPGWPVQYVSPNIDNLNGYSAKEIQSGNIKLLDLIHPEDRERIELEISVYLKQKLPFFTQEYRILKKDSSSIFVIDYSTPIYDENGFPKTVLAYIQDNSERKSFEEQIVRQRNEIQRVHKRLEDTNRVAQVGGWDVDLIHRTIWWSQEMRFLYETSPSYSPTLDMAMELIKEGENKEYFLKIFEESIATGVPYDIEIQILTVTGKPKWVRAIGNPEYVNGQCVRIHGSLQDINQRKLDSFEKALKEEQFKKAFHSSAFGMAIISLSGKFEEVNKSLCDMLGYSKEEMLSRQFQSITHPEDLTIDLNYREELLAGRIESFNREKRYIRKDGQIVYVLLSVSVIKTIEGKPHHFVAQVENTTERVRSNQITKETIANLQSILDASTQVSIISTDCNGLITNFNRGAETLLGYSANEMVGIKSTVSIHKEEEVLARGLELSREFGQKISGFDTFVTYAKLGKYDAREWTFVRKDGTGFPVHSVTTAIRDSEKNIIGFLEIATDISDRKNLERSVIEAKLKAEAANRSKSEFLANMSHEIRTPLNGVIGFTDLLLRTDLNELQKEYMSTVYQSASSLLDLLNDILDFSKIEAGKMEIFAEKVDLRELIGKIMDIIKYKAFEKQLKMSLKMDEETPRYIWADPIRLRQVMLNLLGNAVKFTHEGEIEIKIECLNPSIREAKKVFLFMVKDTGIGISSENRRKIFEAFEQEDASTTRRYGGSGLGLSISNKLLGLMNSYLEVESEVGKGSAFFFKLELPSESHSEEQNSYFKSNDSRDKILSEKLNFPKQNNNDESNVSKLPYVVMIVEDNSVNMQLSKKIILKCIPSAEIIEAVNGKEAVAKFSQYLPQLIFMDIQMPEMNGYDATRKIREMEKGKSVPIIAITAGTLKGEEDRCLEAGMNDYISKPVVFLRIKDTIDKWIRKTASVS
ncbi:PAS domain S-box protein [Leptospira idonii]|uniref:Sensory/regulatory protein RpfC n=1 Tax=Leptospira idonii TaxID=1193500 RepID=A0A4R9M065_9LEPT|nr:PAS domain S-box protein [Leptospira idonii]TGN19037.1 PAS domain S-box protein [Leptospira idonii]